MNTDRIVLSPPLSITAWRAVMAFIALRAGIGTFIGPPVSIFVRAFPGHPGYAAFWAGPSVLAGLLMLAVIGCARSTRAAHWANPLEALACTVIAVTMVWATFANTHYVPGNHISIATEAGEAMFCAFRVWSLVAFQRQLTRIITSPR